MEPEILRSPEIETRNDLPGLVSRRELGLVAVEVGTDLGEYADVILSNWPGRQLVCVDPWAELEDYSEHKRDRSADYFTAASFLTAKHGGRARLFRGTSTEAADTPSLFPWAIDWVYIDGNHNLPHVRQDIKTWWKKLSMWGILSGHDFTPEYPGVIQAVCELSAREGIPVYLTRERSYKSWYCYKGDALYQGAIRDAVSKMRVKNA